MKIIRLVALFLTLAISNVAIATDDDWRDSGLLADRLQQYESLFVQEPSNRNRFNVAAFRFMAGIEQLAQGLYRYDPSTAAARLNRLGGCV